MKSEKDAKPSEILDDLEPSKKVRQTVKVLGRTVFRFACIGKEPSSKETAAFLLRVWIVSMYLPRYSAQVSCHVEHGI